MTASRCFQHEPENRSQSLRHLQMSIPPKFDMEPIAIIYHEVLCPSTSLFRQVCAPLWQGSRTSLPFCQKERCSSVPSWGGCPSLEDHRKPQEPASCTSCTRGSSAPLRRDHGGSRSGGASPGRLGVSSSKDIKRSSRMLKERSKPIGITPKEDTKRKPQEHQRQTRMSKEIKKRKPKGSQKEAQKEKLNREPKTENQKGNQRKPKKETKKRN